MKKIFLVAISAGLFFTACVNNPEGEKVQTGEAQEVTEASGDVFQLNPQESTLQWTGRKVSATHHGKVSFKSGKLISTDGVLSGGNFVVDMNTMTNEDLQGEWKEKLLGHLKSEDFFNVSKFPEASFEITSVKPTDSLNQVTVSGNLVILGVSKNITFNATVDEATENRVKMSTDFNIEREHWGLTYPGKADDLIAKEINFKISIVATK